MNNFKPGDVVIDRACATKMFHSKFGKELVGVVSRIDICGYVQVWGDWLYTEGWTAGTHSDADNCILAPADIAEQVLAEWTAMRLTGNL